nr:hypothetical protein [Clostridium haemolyticum]
MFSDRSGKAVIIEPCKCGISVHRNLMVILINSFNYK